MSIRCLCLLDVSVRWLSVLIGCLCLLNLCDYWMSMLIGCLCLLDVYAHWMSMLIGCLCLFDVYAYWMSMPIECLCPLNVYAYWMSMLIWCLYLIDIYAYWMSLSNNCLYVAAHPTNHHIFLSKRCNMAVYGYNMLCIIGQWCFIFRCRLWNTQLSNRRRTSNSLQKSAIQWFRRVRRWYGSVWLHWWWKLLKFFCLNSS